MNSFRHSLPQLDSRLFLTDGGIETSLIFNEGIELQDFAAFDLLRTEAGRAALLKYFRDYVAIAKRFEVGLILETATWRANPDWATRLGYDKEALATANQGSVDLLKELRVDFPHELVLSGCIGPRGDGYIPGALMSSRQAADYHRAQVETFAGAGADLVTAITMNYVEEAIGVAQAAKDAGMPAVISFTVETDGTLPSGESLPDAIQEVDAATGAHPAYYMLNCAHPTHFEETIRSGSAGWLGRIRGLRANASRMSHAELNESPTLDTGDPSELAGQYANFIKLLPKLNVMGGCCGTDHRHVSRIAEVCSPLFAG
ncbi:MAG: homocysteine S-methyltransferase family protein [Bryobacteraceae bacterium]